MNTQVLTHACTWVHSPACLTEAPGAELMAGGPREHVVLLILLPNPSGSDFPQGTGRERLWQERRLPPPHPLLLLPTCCCLARSKPGWDKEQAWVGQDSPARAGSPGESCVPCVAEDDSHSLPCTWRGFSVHLGPGGWSKPSQSCSQPQTSFHENQGSRAAEWAWLGG